MSEIKTTISLKDLVMIDVRLGEILFAREVEDSDKLVQFKVDFSTFQRAI
ncbi:MAG: hypothetical protein JXR88_01890 [Clostridia bacterium]|nr:hypothetical protein [Clostridia bacterium]